MLALKDWRRSVRVKPARKQLDQLVDMGHRVQRLWEIATHRLRIADAEVRRDIPIWGRPETIPAASAGVAGRHVSREEIEASLADPDGAHQRLRRIMDAWCALWFWPLTEASVSPPTVEEWFDALAMILGRHAHRGDKHGQQTLSAGVGWDALGALEEADRVFAGVQPIEAVLKSHPWFAVGERVAEQQGFFHWGLEFAPVFAASGGFDLQVGNPPWVRPESNEKALLAEGNPWWQLVVAATQAELDEKRKETLALPGIRRLVLAGEADIAAIAVALRSPCLFPVVGGLRPNLYRCFMEQTWLHRSQHGISALIHPETHFTDHAAGRLRASAYRRLRRHWQFVNELKLFETQNQKTYGVHVYGEAREDPGFVMATSLYHPDTVTRSFAHGGSGDEPGLKDPSGAWDMRPHRGRLFHVDLAVLKTWQDLLESGNVPVLQSRMVYTVNRASAATLTLITNRPRVAAIGVEFSTGWNETGARAKGYLEKAWGPADSWRDVIMQGSHFSVGLPFNKTPNESMANQRDWSPVDVEALTPDQIPVTSFKPRGDAAAYNAAYTHWGTRRRTPARDHFRVAWRAMAANSGERTLMPAIIPPGATHVHTVSSVGFVDQRPRDLVVIAGFAASLLSDFVVRAVPKSGIQRDSVERLAIADVDHTLMHEIVLRTLRLNCLTSAYAGLWRDTREGGMMDDGWTGGIDYVDRRSLDDVTADWTRDIPLRRASDRRQALVELDSLVALTLGLPADDLCTIYRTQFPVLYGYDRNTYIYDANGRLVPNSVLTSWRAKGDDRITEDERTATNASGNTYVYELPFVTLDREADMRTAYAEFERRLAERTDG